MPDNKLSYQMPSPFALFKAGPVAKFIVPSWGDKLWHIGLSRREIISVRGQSHVLRLPKYWSPTPSPPGECVPPPMVRGEDTLAGWRGGWWVNILEEARHSSALYLYRILFGLSYRLASTLKKSEITTIGSSHQRAWRVLVLHWTQVASSAELANHPQPAKHPKFADQSLCSSAS